MVSRRTFAKGIVAGAAAVTAPHVLTGAAAAGRPGQPWYAETTLWDSEVDPHVNYHVHGLVALPDDTVVVATEGRHEVCDAGPRDLLVRRSTDGGATWTPAQTVVASVDGTSWGNPAFVVDRTTGELFLFYNLGERLPENTGCSADSAEMFVVSSTDGGVTWGAPRSLSHLFAHFDYDWTLDSPGPGHGIQLDSGRLLLNVAHRRVIVGNTVAERMYGVASIYSDDHGRTWHATGAVPVSADYPINEARLLQRPDGAVYINGRAASGGNRQRIVAVSHDRGLTWSPPKLDGATGVFNAIDTGMLQYTGGPGDGASRDAVSRVLFSRPDSPMRWNMTVAVSYDDSHSYRYSRVVNPGRSYYSDLARLSDGTILLLYGRDGDIASFPRRIVLARFNLEWLTGGRDSLRSGPRLAAYRHDLGRTLRQARWSGGTAEVVAEPTARAGARALFTPEAVGDWIEYPFVVRGPGEYELWLRYYRPVAGGLVTVTVDGREPYRSTFDTTAESSDGYDVVQLDRVRLSAGRHLIRFTLAGPGSGGGQLVSVDELTLVAAPYAADIRDEVTIDNGGPGYQVVSGTWPNGTGVAGYHGSNYASHAAGTGTSVVRWQPTIPGTDDYEVQVSYSAASNRATNAPYTVRHAAGTTTVRVNQQVRGTPDPRTGEWVSLGTFRFTAGTAGHVELSDDADGTVVADAVRFLRR